MSNALATINYSLPAGIDNDEFYNDLAKTTNYLKSIKLYTKGKAIDQGLIAPGHWGVYVSQTEIADLGTTIDVLPFSRRPCAIDWSNKQNIIRVYSELDPEFKRIRTASGDQNSNCQAGVSVLLFERNTGDFYDWFCYSKSTLKGARELFAYLPINEETAAAKGVEPRGALPATLKIKLMTGKFSYHAPDIRPCSAPIVNLPEDVGVTNAEIDRFKNPPKSGGQLVADADFDGRDR